MNVTTATITSNNSNNNNFQRKLMNMATEKDYNNNHSTCCCVMCVLVLLFVLLLLVIIIFTTIGISPHWLTTHSTVVVRVCMRACHLSRRRVAQVWYVFCVGNYVHHMSANDVLLGACLLIIIQLSIFCVALLPYVLIIVVVPTIVASVLSVIVSSHRHNHRTFWHPHITCEWHASTILNRPWHARTILDIDHDTHTRRCSSRTRTHACECTYSVVSS